MGCCCSCCESAVPSEPKALHSIETNLVVTGLFNTTDLESNNDDDGDIKDKQEVRKGQDSNASSIEKSEDRSRELLEKVCMIIRYIFRDLFGELMYEKQGYFVDKQLGVLVHRFHADNFEYPEGNHSFQFRGRTQFGCAAVSTDGRYIFVPAGNGQIACFDLADLDKGTLIHQWEASESVIKCMSFDRGLLASGGTDELVQVWDGYNFEHRMCLKGHTSVVFSVCFTFDGSYLVSGSCDGTCRLWSLENGDCLSQFIGDPRNWKLSVLCVSDSNILISGIQGGWIRGWNYSQCLGKDDRNGHIFIRKLDIESGVCCLSMNCDNSLLLSSTPDQTQLWKWPSMEQNKEIHHNGTSALCFHPKNPYIYAIALDDSLYPEIELHDSRVIRGRLACFTGHSRVVHFLGFSPDGRKLFSVASDKTIRMWDVSKFGMNIET